MANVLTTTGPGCPPSDGGESRPAVPEHTHGATTPPNRRHQKTQQIDGPCCKICVDEFVPEERADQKEQLAESLACTTSRLISNLQQLCCCALRSRQYWHDDTLGDPRQGCSASVLIVVQTVGAAKGTSTGNQGHRENECCNVCGDELSPERNVRTEGV